MAQIFISHSQRDEDLRNFFSNAFAGTKVKAIFEEFEKILRGRVTSEHVAKDIEDSKAIFVVLSQKVQDIPHTRDWVIWETGVAKSSLGIRALLTTRQNFYCNALSETLRNI